MLASGFGVEQAGISQLQKLIEEVSKELEEKVSVTEFVTEMKKQLKLKVLSAKAEDNTFFMYQQCNSVLESTG